MWPKLLFCVGIISYVHGSCYFSQISVELTETGRHRYICEYTLSNSGLTKGAEFQSTLKVFPGSKFTTTDCVSCECSLDGLQCCGIGRFGGVAVPPDGCVFLADGCNQLLVKQSNSSLDCLTGKPITHNDRVMTSDGGGFETGNTILQMSGPMSVTGRQEMENFNSMVERRFNGGLFGSANQLKPDKTKRTNSEVLIADFTDPRLSQSTVGNMQPLFQDPGNNLVQLLQGGATQSAGRVANIQQPPSMRDFSQPKQVDLGSSAMLRRMFGQSSSALTSDPLPILNRGLGIQTVSGQLTDPVKMQSHSILQGIVSAQQKQPLPRQSFPRPGMGSFLLFDD